MEGSTIVLGSLMTAGLVAWRLLQERRISLRVTTDRLLGPLPEGEDAEIADPGQFQPRSPVGSTPPFADPIPSVWAANQGDDAGGLLNLLTGSVGVKLGIAAGAGLGLGLGLLGVAQRRARRRRRIERLRHGARRVVNVANTALLLARSRTGNLPGELPLDFDRRSSTGGGVALLATLGLLAAVRSRRERASRAEDARRLALEAAEAAEAASRPGWRNFGRRARTLVVSTDRVARPIVVRQLDRGPGWLPPTSALVLAAVVLVVRAVQGRREVEAPAGS
jgi:hypothetical protein